MERQVYNPYLPSYEYIPDGEPYVFDGRLYVYGSHDVFGSMRYCSDEYVLWSADENDLSSWTCHGTVYRREQDPMHTANSNHLHAPDVALGIDGKYYLYYPNPYYIGVAVSDKPCGPFEFYGRVSYPDGTPYGMGAASKNIRPISADDPAILVDEGRIWLYTGYVPSNPQTRSECEAAKRRYEGAFCVELEKDMLTVKGEPGLIAPGKGFGNGTSFEGNEFFEASGIRKINGTYYFVYSSHRSHDLCYATSKYPDRDFVYRGILVSCIDGGISPFPTSIPCNTHGNLVSIKNKWYIFYHRSSGSKFARQGCAEEIKMLSDGSFMQAEITSCGLNGKPLSAAGYYSAHIACNLLSDGEHGSPFFTQDGADGDECPQYVSGITQGCRIGYKYFDFSGEPLQLTVTLRGEAEGRLEIFTDQACVDPIAILRIEKSKLPTRLTADICTSKGKLPLFFTFTGTGSIDLFGFDFK